MVIRSMTAPSGIQVDAVPAASTSTEIGEYRPSSGSRSTSAPVSVTHKEKYELTISDQVILKAIEKANKSMQGMDRRFEYKIHEKTGDVLIKVINSATDEVVREIPNEKFLDLIAKLQELVGLNIDEKR